MLFLLMLLVVISVVFINLVVVGSLEAFCLFGKEEALRAL